MKWQQIIANMKPLQTIASMKSPLQPRFGQPGVKPASDRAGPVEAGRAVYQHQSGWILGNVSQAFGSIAMTEYLTVDQEFQLDTSPNIQRRNPRVTKRPQSSQAAPSPTLASSPQNRSASRSKAARSWAELLGVLNLHLDLQLAAWSMSS